MVTLQSLPLTRQLRVSLLATLTAFCLMFFTSVGTMANTVRISDPVGVLNASQVSSEGAKLSYPLDIYTTNTYSGSAASFVLRTISAHLTSKSLIVIAMDTIHHYLAIVNGSSVPLSKSQDTDAGTAFKNAFHGGNFTSATIAAIQSLESALSPSKGGPWSGLVLVIIVVGLFILLIISAIVGFFRRLFGFAPRTSSQPIQQQQAYEGSGNYGDGRDNFGSGAVGDF